MKIRFIISMLPVVILASIANLEAFEILTYEDVTSTTTGRYDEMKWWWDDNLTFHVETASIPEDSSPLWQALERATVRFNDNPSKFTVSLTPHSGSRGLTNGRSEIWLVGGGFRPPAATYINALILFLPPHDVILGIAEADIKIRGGNLNDNWTDSYKKEDLWRFGGPHRSLISTSLHEMGHAVGLGHVNYEYNIMGIDYTHLHVNGDFATAYVGEDATDGLVYLYDTKPSAKEDVGVVNWKYAGAASAYSSHTITDLNDSSGGDLPYTEIDYDGDNDADARHWRVNPGQSVMVEFTYENNGVTTQEGVSVGFYLSTDARIDTEDEKIGMASLSLGRNRVYTTSHRVRIPSDVALGRHWIGAFIDEDDSISEQVEWNNATYIPILIVAERLIGDPLEDPEGGFIDPGFIDPYPYP